MISQYLNFGIIAMLLVGSSWCITGLIMGQAPKKGIAVSVLQLCGAALSFIASGALIIILKKYPNLPISKVLFICSFYFIGGFMNCIMLQLMSRAMQRGPNGIIWAIIQAALVFPFMGGVIFWGVELSFYRILGIIFILIALLLLGLGKNNNNYSAPWKGLAFICLAICAVQQNLVTIPSYLPQTKEIDSIIRTFSNSCGIISASIFLIVKCRTSYRLYFDTFKLPLFWVFVCSLQLFNLILAYTLLYPGFDAMAEAGLGSMSYPLLVGSCIISFSLASRYILKEQFKKMQIAGIILCLVGLILICTKV